MKTEIKTNNFSTKEIVKTLEEGLKNLFQSDKYKEYLTTMSKFHHYSMNNTLLIAQQKPDASYVAGYESWQRNFGRQVKKNEKGIKIIVPIKRKKEVFRDKVDPVTGEIVFDDKGEPVIEKQELSVPAFKISTVFDISQTEGPELPSLGVYELKGELEEYELFRKVLEKSCPVPVEYRPIFNGAKGFYDSKTKQIVIQENMENVQTVKTLIHEMTHQRLHDKDTGETPDKPKETKELEAESVAYTVCKHFGIDTSEYSFGYVAGWSRGKGVKELRESLNLIIRTSDSIIREVEENYAQVMLDNYRPPHVDKNYILSNGNNLHAWTQSKESVFYTITDKNGKEIEADQFIGSVEDLLKAKAGAEYKEEKTEEERPSVIQKLNEKKEIIANKKRIKHRHFRKQQR